MRELGQAKGELKQAQNELEEAKPHVTQVKELQEKLKHTNEKVVGLGDKVEQLKLKMEGAKDVGVVEFKGSISYLMAIGQVAAEFLAKEKIKIRRLMQSAHNIEDLSFLDNINMEPTFFDINGDREEEIKEVEQVEPPRGSSPRQSPPA